MAGLLAVLETVLVLSLTFVALATAASSLAGTAMRLARLRAKGLRDMVEYLFRNHVIPLLQRLNTQFLDPDRGATRGPFDAVLNDTASRPDSLCQFIVDLTMAPQPLPPSGNGDPRIAAVRANGWDSRRKTLDAISIEDFRVRLESSALGHDLRNHFEATGQPERLGVELDLLTRQFASSQSGARETFARKARALSVAFGFLLAIGLNVDSVNLFSTYLTDPSQRASVLAQREGILGEAERGQLSGEPAQDAGVSATETEKTMREAEARLDLLLTRLDVIANSDVMTKADPESELVQVSNTALKQAREVSEQAKLTLRDVSTAVGELRQTAAIVTERFPIGWNRYPGCETVAADPRCLLTEPKNGDVGLARLQARVGDAPGTFINWLIGVLLTGLLLGLGTPFWVQVVNHLLRIRQLGKDARAAQPSGP